MISLLIGLAAGILYTTGTLPDRILYGVVLGLSACGLYSGVKNTVEDFSHKVPDVPLVGVATEGSDSDEPED